MIEVNCNISKRTFQVKKICKVSEMPQSANYFFTAFTTEGIYDIWRTDAGIFYSKPLNTIYNN